MNRIAGLLIVASSLTMAQQQMSLSDCEEAFQRNSLQLLAEQYNINMAEADILQAKIWELPQLGGQINAYNPENRKVFDVGRAKGAEISQFIYMGGKKKNEITFAKSNKELAQLQFSQLLADLRVQLHMTYYNLYYERLTAKPGKRRISKTEFRNKSSGSLQNLENAVQSAFQDQI